MQDIHIVFLGHKDHGKSTLIGRLILDSQSIHESRFRAIKEAQEALGQKFELAHLVDSFKEEREREMTMDTVRACLKWQEKKYQIVDVPGHEELIGNMLTGAAGGTAAILVVSAEEGIKEQTCQHLEIAQLLGIKQLAVAVNKIDTVGYSQARFHHIEQKLKDILNPLGYSSERVHFFPISARDGDNVFKKSRQTPWYKGATLIDFMDHNIEPLRSLEKDSNVFLIQDRYDDLLVGRVESGQIRTGDGLIALPEKKSIKVLSIQDATGPVSKAVLGQSVGVKISGDLKALSRGSVLAGKDCGLIAGRELAGEIFWIKKPAAKQLTLCCGTAHVACELKESEEMVSYKKSFCQIFLEQPITFDPSQKTILGKIVLKESGEIIGVGNAKYP